MGSVKENLTKAQLREVYLRWARDEGEAADVLHAVGSYLGWPEVKQAQDRAIASQEKGEGE